jgi:hypothetical protein
VKPIARWLITFVGVFLLVFGLGCLNYTEAGGYPHHTQFAAEHGLPKPSEPLMWLGALAIVAGSGSLGYLVGSAKSGTGTKVSAV